jgi:hypothetical protein
MKNVFKGSNRVIYTSCPIRFGLQNVLSATCLPVRIPRPRVPPPGALPLPPPPPPVARASPHLRRAALRLPVRRVPLQLPRPRAPPRFHSPPPPFSHSASSPPCSTAARAPNRHTLPSLPKSACSASAVAEAIHAQCLRRGRPLRRLLAHQRLRSVRSPGTRRAQGVRRVGREPGPCLPQRPARGALPRWGPGRGRELLRADGREGRCIVDHARLRVVMGRAPPVRSPGIQGVFSGAQRTPRGGQHWSVCSRPVGFLLGRLPTRTSSVMILTSQRSWARLWLTCTGSFAAVTVLLRLSLQ